MRMAPHVARDSFKALAEASRNCWPVCEVSNMEPYVATLKADLAASLLLASAELENLQVLGAETSLPPLPMFYFNLHLTKASAGDPAVEPARHIHRQFAARYHRAA